MNSVAQGPAFDLKGWVDYVLAALTNPNTWLLIAAAVAAIWVLRRSARFFGRVGAVIEEMIFDNWQLALLGAAAIVLSLASGWTTWDGLRNFSGYPMLSLAIAFGIQSVMLITAWLIGESFASGMSQQSASGSSGWSRPLLSAFVGVLLFAVLSMIVLQLSGVLSLSNPDTYRQGWTADADKLFYVLAALLVIAMLVLMRGSDVAAPDLRSARVIAKNVVLWVMFLVCMSASVFFSFDSHFNALFPPAERVRASELRAQNQITGLVSDIEQTINKRRIEESEALFHTDGWTSYEASLVRLINVARDSTSEVERYFNDQIEDRNRAIKQQQERIATAQSGQAGLASKKIALTDELSRLRGERPTLAAEYAEKKNELDNRAKEIDAKRVEAMAEDRGVEGTLKEGKGPVYRQRMGELGKLQDYYKIGEERVKDAQKRLAASDTRISQLERELSAVDGELARFKGEAETANQRIKMAQDSVTGSSETRIDPSRMLPALENDRAEFRATPTADRLAAIQQRCNQIYAALSSTPATKSKLANIDCDPKRAAEAAAMVFTLEAGTKAFDANCVGGDKLAPLKTTDSFFGFARKCLVDSGLPSKDTEALRSKINFMELIRDDKAHRFVVTWNAFYDGNRLAYLALVIAISVDGLVFMAGLFGANAVRSPLSDVPTVKARSAHQLEAIIENALLPDKFENATLVLEAMHPIAATDGFTAEVMLPYDHTPSRRRILRVLNAGATIGAVGRDAYQPNRYLVRPELFEFLSVVARDEFNADEEHAERNELEQIVTVALLPDVGRNAEDILRHVHAMNGKDGFTSEVDLEKIREEETDEEEAKHLLRVTRSVLNAGATVGKVQRQKDEATRYEIHRDLYKTLLRIRAKALIIPYGEQPQIAGPGAYRQGGSLNTGPAQLPGYGAMKQIPARFSDGNSGPPPLNSFDDAPNTDPEARILTRMLTAIGLNYEDYELLLPLIDKDIPAAAIEAMQQLGSADAAIGDELLRIEKAREDALDKARRELLAELSEEDDETDAQRRRFIENTAEQCERMIHAGMLKENGALELTLRQIKDEYERQDGEGHLSDLERLRLRHIAAAEHWKSTRRSTEGWLQLADALKLLAQQLSDANAVANGGQQKFGRS
ncbi:MAG: hypothetical protein AB7K67_08945 [Hyphomicrobiaceae bacterium]